MLEIPQLSICLAIILKAGAPGFDRLAQNIADKWNKTGDPLGRQLGRRPVRSDASPEKHLANLDIA